MRAHHVPAPGETVLGRELAIVPGGKGANQAVACARAGGVATRMVLALGEDAFAPLMEKSLRDAGVVLHIVRVAQAASGVALICLADNAENAITVAPGANAMLRESDLPPLDGIGYLLLQLETPLETVTAFAHAARDQGVKVLLNAAPACALPAGLLAAVDVLIVNEDELAKVAGRHGAVAEVLASLDVPVCGRHSRRAWRCAAERGTFFLQPAFKVEPVDTTAAGDTFCGTLAAALCSGSPLPQALRRASAAAALATTRVGAQSSIPDVQEVEALLRSHADGRPGATDELARYCGVRSFRS